MTLCGEIFKICQNAASAHHCKEHNNILVSSYYWDVIGAKLQHRTIGNSTEAFQKRSAHI